MSRRCPSCQTVFPDEISFCGNDGTITIQVEEGTPDPRLGTQLGSYVVVARIADGAMGRVYEGRHIETKARVAVKVLHDDVAKDTVAVERFKREAETAQSMPHPHIVHVIEFGQTADGSYFMTMEYLQGEELGQALRRNGAVARERIVRVISQAALALEHAHSFGVIHRDLKPDNVFLCETLEGDVVRLLDFGSVKLQMETGPKLTAFGTTLGSPYYMSPEQAMGKQDVDSRSDVFALGAILFEMITGKIAFEAPNVAGILLKIVNENPPPASSVTLGSPAAVDDVIEKALRKDKTRRYASTREFADAMLSAYGLTGGIDAWAMRPASEIAAALAQTVPAAPRPFGVESLRPPAPAPAAAAPAVAAVRPAAPKPMHAAPADIGGDVALPQSSSKLGLWIGIAVAVVVVIVGAVMFSR